MPAVMVEAFVLISGTEIAKSTGHLNTVLATLPLIDTECLLEDKFTL